MYIYTPFRLCSFALCEVELFVNGAGGRRKSNDDVHLQMRPATGRSALFLLSLLAAEAATAESPSSVCCLRMRFPLPLIIYVYAFCSRARAHIRGERKTRRVAGLMRRGTSERAALKGMTMMRPSRDDARESIEFALVHTGIYIYICACVVCKHDMYEPEKNTYNGSVHAREPNSSYIDASCCASRFSQRARIVHPIIRACWRATINFSYSLDEYSTFLPRPCPAL